MKRYILALTVWDALDRIYSRHGIDIGAIKVSRSLLPVIWQYEIEGR